MPQDLAGKLREAIAASGIAHNELARQTGVPQPTITRFVNGKDMLLSRATPLAAYFGLTLQPDNTKPAKSRAGPVDTPEVKWGGAKAGKPKGRR